MYIVHMKRMTASEARRDWFRLLDEVAAGETVVIIRNGRRIIMRREDSPAAGEGYPDYSGLLQVREPESADRWGWRWTDEAGLAQLDLGAGDAGAGEVNAADANAGDANAGDANAGDAGAGDAGATDDREA
jgi:hypothetical protein